MSNRIWIFVRKTLPLTNVWVAFSAIAGLGYGALHLNESVDLATAIGIASFFSIAVGAWPALILFRLLMRGYATWLESIFKTLTPIESQMLAVSNPAEQEPRVEPTRSVLARLVACSFHLTLFCSAAFTTSLLNAMLLAQINDHGYIANLVLPMVVFVILAIFVVVQSLYIFSLHQRSKTIERRMKLISMISNGSAPLPGSADVLVKGMTQTERIGTLFLSVSGSSPKRSAG